MALRGIINKMISDCPGAKRFRQPEQEIIECPRCKEDVEIWTDEIKAYCPKCKMTVLRKAAYPSCLDWCKYAKECVGDKVYKQYLKNKASH